ncbi:phosphotransferase [Thalassotalea sp. M1531]|uniref:Phosphotransferase n=1 Tax=Thalassotalea algicola TaxID=2716224 RepID=A0A7Y0LDJ3_9GAMM|nr:phosphotransferase [Thalassotalea algicola]NMP32302.1 phosphotransferase [Thalassotalea algicola]
MAILELIKSNSLFAEKKITIQSLVGGYNNKVFKVSTAERDYLVKYFKDTNTANHEALSQQIATLHNLAPKIIAAEKHLLISQFIDANTLERHPITIKQKLVVAARLMANLHSITVEEINTVPVLNISKVISDLYKSINQRECFYSLVKKSTAVLAELDRYPKSEVFIHGDLNFNNILYRKCKRPYLIDFEASSLAPIEYELGMLLAVNGLSEDYIRELIELYVESSYVIDSIDEYSVTRYMLVSALINGLWYFKEYELRNDVHYKNLALQQINLAEKLITP